MTLTALTIGLSIALSQTPAPHEHHQRYMCNQYHTVRMGSHGMVVFGGGKGAVFLSHIPMFRAPHDLQLILQVKLRHPSWKATPSFDEEGHTLESEHFDLSALADGRLRGFKGTVYRGNFQAGGDALWKDVVVTVEQVLVARGIEENGYPALALQYWLISAPGQTYLLHYISRAPDYDHVLTAKGGEGKGRPSAYRVELLERSDGLKRRLKPGEKVTLAIDADARRPVQVTVGRELSFLVGPDFMP
jgi:hypothetical protein